MNVAVILAGGKGRRMKLDRDSKQLLLLNGKPVFLHSLDAFYDSGLFDRFIVVYNPDFKEKYEQYLMDYNNVIMVEAGSERWRSSQNALEEIERIFPETRIVAIHDGARPFIKKELIKSMIKEVNEDIGVIPGIYLKDTIKRLGDDNIVIETPIRNEYARVMTPQMFDFKGLLKAYRNFEHNGSAIPTDDAMMFEAFGKKVKVIIGDESNIKITTPEDVIIAVRLIKLKINNEK